MEEILIMRVLIMHRYYYPERVPCAGIVRSIATRLSQDGHKVDVLSANPNRFIEPKRVNETEIDDIDGMHISRLSLQPEDGHPVWRVINALHLGVMLLFKAIFTRYDVIISTSIPPVLGGFFSSIAARLTCGRFIYYCMDLHPEIAGSREILPTLFFIAFCFGLMIGIAGRLGVLVHSKDMRNTLRTRP